ncbi:RNA polymerase sigma factor [Haliscomenobacter sp.]|uniref:RNA polymerase sigma factor n=1 Tax=Haliscomenobacter sp. TaxID=2717303 RepID=UPI003BAC3DAD
MSGIGNSAAFQELIEQHRGILYKVARAYCSLEEERQDLIQEMMIQIWQALPRYNAQYKSSTWIYRIALNVAISYYRKTTTQQRRQQALDAKALQGVEADSSEKERQFRLLEQFISELKELDRALMVLYLEDRNHAEIAEILGISISNVATKVGRIKDKLKQRFSQHQNQSNGR